MHELVVGNTSRVQFRGIFMFAALLLKKRKNLQIRGSKFLFKKTSSLKSLYMLTVFSYIPRWVSQKINKHHLQK